MAYQYLVVPFIGRSRGTASASEVATQLEDTIKANASLGWEFYQLTDVNIEVAPGCIAGLFGATTQYVRFDQLIFRADQSAVMTRAAAAVPATVASESVYVPLQGSAYQPAVLPNGNVECWNCGESNKPYQDKCWACYTKLREKN